MIRSTLRPSFALLALAAGTLLACNRDKAPEEKSGPVGQAWWAGKITIDGSSTVLPLSMAMGEAFQKANPAIQLVVESSGTTGGFRKMCAGKITIANASRAINAAEAALCKEEGMEYIELPVAFDSLSVVVSAKNSFVHCLTTAELKTIWEPGAEGKIRLWSQVRPTFPAEPLKLFGPGKDSGTFDYFTLAIMGAERKSRNDYTSSEDDTVLEEGVAADANALGYFGYAYYLANKDKLKLVAIDSGKGCVVPSPQTVADATYQPLARPLFIYVNSAVAAQPEVRAFTRFFLASENAKYVSRVGYVPLPSATLQAQLSRYENRMKGSALGNRGSITGVKLESFEPEAK
jgi:phosphate transport system substrate-binding protein